MTAALVLATTVLLSPSLTSQSGPPSHISLSNTFITAAETVIEYADKVEIAGPDDRFNAEMRDLKTAKDNLDRMSYEDREHEVVGADNDLIFAISACRVQAKDGSDTHKCEAQVKSARARVMELLGKHKDGGAWVNGAPTN